MIGILPTLADGHMTADSLSPNPRYKLLSEQILDARGEDISISIAGIGNATGSTRPPTRSSPRRRARAPSSTSRRRPDDFAEYWNASQASPASSWRSGANSPYLLGKELWRETRIPLFEQATDTRSEELKAQGVRPRVWFGERWVNSVFDLFEENVRYFPALLPITDDEDPLAVLESGGTPELAELRLHNGTIYRWNRPVYDIAGGVPHLRVENRVLAAGPTVADTVANAAFYFGLVRALAENERPLWSQMSFSAAEENFHVAAQQGIDAQIYWPGVGQVRVTELVLRRLLPLAHEGLAAWGVEQAAADRLLGIIEQRCLTGINGAEWFVSRMAPARRPGPLRRAPPHAAGLPRADAHQRARPHLGLGGRQPAAAARSGRPRCAGPASRGRLTTTMVRSTPASAYAVRPRPATGRRGRAGSSSPVRVSHTSGGVRRRRRPSIAATMSARSAWSVGSSTRPRTERTGPPGTCPRAAREGSAPARVRTCSTHGPAQQPLPCSRSIGGRSIPATPAPSPPRRGPHALHRLPPGRDWVPCRHAGAYP